MKVTLRVLLILISIFCAFMAVDYTRAMFDKTPIFAIYAGTYKDGGSVLYQGLGYSVMDYNQLDGEGRQDVAFNISIRFLGKRKQ